MNIEEYWNDFLIKNKLPLDTKYYDAFYFFDYSEEGIERLTNLVLSGKKKATTSAYLENEEYPHIGSYSIVLNSNNIPVCIIQTTRTRIMRFKDMTYEIARLEGEDDRLDTWLFNHSLVFEQESKELGYIFSVDMPIFFEEFEVVWKF